MTRKNDDNHRGMESIAYITSKGNNKSFSEPYQLVKSTTIREMNCMKLEGLAIKRTQKNPQGTEPSI